MFHDYFPSAIAKEFVCFVYLESCPGGEIGRHAILRGWCWQRRAGSTPVQGTPQYIGLLKLFVFEGFFIDENLFISKIQCVTHVQLDQSERIFTVCRRVTSNQNKIQSL